MAGNTIDTKEREGWDPSEHYKNTAIAEEYDRVRFKSVAGRVFNRLEKEAIKRSFAGLPANSLILDAPSGTGRLAEELLEMGHRVIGVDISPHMLEVAKKKLARFGDRYETRVADVKTLDPKELQVDAVLCARVLMHFPLDEAGEFLKSVSRLTSGPVVFNHSVVTTYHRGRRVVKKALRNQNSAGYSLAPGDVSTLISAAGLKEQSRTPVLPGVSEAVFFTCNKA